uniref:Fusion glycoprotein F0 n=1 Tax=Parastrongyloides trichosuri TaxID=131310 RepID=A0A0N5A6U7_PARTI
MFLIHSILALSIIFYQVHGSCNVYSNYYMLGKWTRNSLQNLACKYANDSCVYISLNVPALAIGTFTGCSSDVGAILTSIVNKRIDVRKNFDKFFNNNIHLIDMELFCNVRFLIISFFLLIYQIESNKKK